MSGNKDSGSERYEAYRLLRTTTNLDTAQIHRQKWGPFKTAEEAEKFAGEKAEEIERHSRQRPVIHIRRIDGASSERSLHTVSDQEADR